MSVKGMLPKSRSDRADHVVISPSHSDYCSEVENGFRKGLIWTFAQMFIDTRLEMQQNVTLSNPS